MVNGDTKRETIEQRISRGRRQIVRQLEIVQALRLQGYPTDGAERLLINLEYLQRFNEAQLAKLAHD